jgi:hypothetical protein
MVELEKHWRTIGNSRLPFLHYDRAMLMLKLGAFDDAEVLFRKFLTDNPSLKHTLIHFLFIISKIVHYDIVNPVAATKEQLEKFF